MSDELDEITAERLRLVSRLRSLPESDWDTQSLCELWTVRQVVAHLVTPFLVSTGAMALAMLRHRGISAAMNSKAQQIGARPPTELLEVLERNASSAFHPPGATLVAPLTDIVVHSADIRWVIGDERADWADPQRLSPILDFVVSPQARRGFVPPDRIKGLRFVADDLDWQHGTGVEVRGSGLAIATAILGRSAAWPLLMGDGAVILAAR